MKRRATQVTHVDERDVAGQVADRNGLLGELQEQLSGAVDRARPYGEVVLVDATSNPSRLYECARRSWSHFETR